MARSWGKLRTSETFRPCSFVSGVRTRSPLHPDRLLGPIQFIKTTDVATKGPNHLQPKAAENLLRRNPDPAAPHPRIRSDSDNPHRLSHCPMTSMRRQGLGAPFTMMFAGSIWISTR